MSGWWAVVGGYKKGSWGILKVFARIPTSICIKFSRIFITFWSWSKTFIFVPINSYNGKGHFGLVVNGLRVTKGVKVRTSPRSDVRGPSV